MFNQKLFIALVFAAGFIVAEDQAAVSAEGTFAPAFPLGSVPKIDVSRPVPSPDGKLLIWEQTGAPGNVDLGSHSRIMIADSRKPLSLETFKRVFTRTKTAALVRPLTRPDEGAYWPAFSPDGKWVTFLSQRGDPRRGQVFALPLNGGEAEPLTSHPENVFSYQWGNDGSMMYAAGPDSAHQSLYIRLPNGTEVLLVRGIQAINADSSATAAFGFGSGDDQPIPSRAGGFDFAFSHDAKRLAYRERLSTVPSSSSEDSSGAANSFIASEDLVETVINIWDRDQGHARPLPVRIPRQFTGKSANLRWSWDDGELYYLGAPPPGARSSDRAIHRLNPDTGETPAEPVTKRFRGSVKEFETCVASDRIFALGIERSESALTKDTREACVALRIRPREGTHETLFEIEGGDSGASARDLATNANGEKLHFVLPRMKQTLDMTHAAIASWTFPDETYAVLFPTAQDSAPAQDPASKDAKGDPLPTPQREESP